ncbi:MAG: tryptophan--tRNA ligase, partial [Acidimicrobiales bacterium]|nr:tryptophan--tRNA ligase [Acidimicrobiales bacterium]
KRAVTDSDGEVRFDVAAKPGVSNLLSILGAATGREPDEASEDIDRYGDLKAATAEAVIEMLRPIQARYHELAADPAETSRLLAVGADKAAEVASTTLERARRNIGLLGR